MSKPRKPTTTSIITCYRLKLTVLIYNFINHPKCLLLQIESFINYYFLNYLVGIRRVRTRMIPYGYCQRAVMQFIRLSYLNIID